MHSHKFSYLCNHLKEGPMKKLYKYYIPSAINLAGGVPMDSIFPFDEVTFKLSGTEERITISANNLKMNYQRGDGRPELKSWISKHMKKHHAISDSYSSCVTVGSTDSFAKTLSLFNGDAVLFDEYAYGAAVNTARCYGRQPLGVEMDKDGIIPKALEQTIRKARDNNLRPDILYLTPTAHNPTGITMSNERKRDVYRVCEDEDIIIVVDDAYYYLHHGNFDVNESLRECSGLNHLPQSFISLDTSKRVIRFDSLSKVIAPGMRLGWVTAPSEFVDKYMLLQEITTQFPAGLSQTIFLELLNRWGDEGLHQHIKKIQEHYLAQRNALCKAIYEHFTPEQCEFVLPSGGMFVWLKFPANVYVEQFEAFKTLSQNGIIVVPGESFAVDKIVPQTGQSYYPFRLTYAAVQPEGLVEGVKRLASSMDKCKSTL